MADTSDREFREHVQAIAELLDDQRSADTVALDVRETCTFADYFVVSTVNSQGHLRGLITRLDELFGERDLHPLHPRRRTEDAGWLLVDLGFAVVHLMTVEMREFYELERLWFGAARVYSSESQSGSSSGSESGSSGSSGSSPESS